MKLWKQTLIGTLFALSTLAAHAHGNHGDEEPISKDGATARGNKVIEMLVDSKKLQLSWKMTSAKEISSRDTPNGPVWVVSYQNPAESDTAKRTLYIFLDDVGNYLGANHTGTL
ncbi:DUF6488 family protein [Chitinimonas viridis]|uniref:DUF6488 family protein n=1 Tax=Chitinimonas viridis TaxID=664880 RepID=A0ABT8B9V4_9NEIS|nr:DUF6488 family protein [Chitinimonas viridis]MDN3578820.1 DUF6488 family protein [Chitinimonas viridis]